ncbi:MAG: ORF6N domain-containing protein [Bacteroidetes bacterium]|nr:MAG: ORF6N domain-containing protein [Bacteroidota bacterium]
MKIIRSIQNRIYQLRGERVMLDFDLAALYEVETRVLNQAVKRNIDRFPEDFMFRLKTFELDSIRFQIDSIKQSSSSQFVMMGEVSQNRTDKYLPYAFTEQGVAMLSGVLNSEKAVKMNIAIMRAFVEIRRIVLNQKDFKKQLQEIKKRIGNHDMQISHIYEAIENLLDEKASQIKWEERERIGFKK